MKIQDIYSSTNIFRMIKQKKENVLDVWDDWGKGEGKCIKRFGCEA